MKVLIKKILLLISLILISTHYADSTYEQTWGRVDKEKRTIDTLVFHQYHMFGLNFMNFENSGRIRLNIFEVGYGYPYVDILFMTPINFYAKEENNGGVGLSTLASISLWGIHGVCGLVTNLCSDQIQKYVNIPFILFSPELRVFPLELVKIYAGYEFDVIMNQRKELFWIGKTGLSTTLIFFEIKTGVSYDFLNRGQYGFEFSFILNFGDFDWVSSV